MKAALFVVLAALLLAAPTATAAKLVSTTDCLVGNPDPDVGVFCLSGDTFCIADGTDWRRITPDGFGCLG